MKQHPKKVIFDTDGGGDDLWALLLLVDADKRGEIELIGVTTCFGNTSLQNASNNVLNFLFYCGVDDIPVYMGAERTINGERGLADNAFGKDGLSEGTLPKSDKDFEGKSAYDFLCETLSQNPDDQISIIATGPATNLGKVFKDHPEFDRNTVEILWMGGSVLPCAGNHYPLNNEEGNWNRGNITPYMEFNAGNDVPASVILTNLKKAEVTILSLDAGQHMDFSSTYQELLREEMAKIGKGDIADNMIAFLQDVIKLDQKKQGMEGTPIFDAQTVQWFLAREEEKDDLFPESAPLKSVHFTDKSELVPAFLAVSDAGGFAPHLLQDHGQMFVESMPNGEQSNIRILPGRYTMGDQKKPYASQSDINNAAEMGARRASDLVNRVVKSTHRLNFS